MIPFPSRPLFVEDITPKLENLLRNTILMATFDTRLVHEMLLDTLHCCNTQPGFATILKDEVIVIFNQQVNT